MKKKRVFLTGFMGAGKSTLGLILANTMGWDFYDLDRVIEADTGMAVRDYFKENGEQKFRELETETLLRLIGKERIVIALGGGTILKEENFAMMKQSGVLIYLKSSPEHIFLRLRHKMDRPLFQTADQRPMTKEEAMDKIKTMLGEREHIYSGADIIFESDRHLVGKSVDKIIQLIKKQLYN